MQAGSTSVQYDKEKLSWTRSSRKAISNLLSHVTQPRELVLEVIPVKLRPDIYVQLRE
jgi:hypothetical protein